MLVESDEDPRERLGKFARMKSLKNRQLYFMLKLSSTFYLVKAEFTPELNFTFLCDFTTYSSGNQLTFPCN